MIRYKAVEVMAILAANLVLAACPAARPSPETEPSPTVEARVEPEPKTEIKTDTKTDTKTKAEPKTFPVVMNGLWDFIVMFRGEPFSGTFQFSSSSPGAVGRLTLVGYFDGSITIVATEKESGSVGFNMTTPRGTAVFVGRFESNNTLAGVLRELRVGDPDASVPPRLIDETAILSATRRE